MSRKEYSDQLILNKLISEGENTKKTKKYLEISDNTTKTKKYPEIYDKNETINKNKDYFNHTFIKIK